MITFRKLTAADFPLLHDWLNRPHVAEWWPSEGTLESVRAEWEPELELDTISFYIAYLDGEPLGYIQSYDVMRASPDWWQEETDPGARGTDQFLADGARLGQGLGSRMVGQFIDGLFEDPAVTKVQVDPAPSNARAIRAYEKVGFKRVGEITTPDGAALLMVIRREDRSGKQ